VTDGYGWLKLAHVAAVIVWLGGSLALSVLTAAFLRAGNRAVLELFFREAGFFGPMIVGPASLLAFLTGLLMAMVSRSFGFLWVQIGFAGIVMHFVLGAGLIRAASVRVQHAIAATDDDALHSAGRRLRMLNVIYLLLLGIVVAAMVLKPT
jgi:uncharacterized membrane protein